MNILYANVINEAQKIFLRKKTLVLFVITALIPFALCGILSIFQNNIGIIPINSSQFSIFILGIFTNYILPLLITMAAVDMFSGEFNDRTIKSVLLRPISRFKIYLSKIICIGIYIILNLLLLFLVSSITGLFLQGNGSLINSLLRGFVAYLTSIVPMLGIGIAVAFISQLFKSSSGALVVSIIIYIALTVLSRLFPGVSRSLLTSFSDWYLLWIGSSIMIEKILNAFIIILSYSMIFFATGFYLFDRKEI